MRRYLVTRLLIFIPTIVLISLLCFWLASMAPGDAAQNVIGMSADGQPNEADQSDYLAMRKKMGLDRPLFYFSLSNAANSDTLYRIIDPLEREAMARMCESTGLPEQVGAYRNALLQLRQKKYGNSVYQTLDELIHDGDVQRSSARLQMLTVDSGEVGRQATQLLAILPIQNQRPYMKYLPVLHWYGFENQYHQWLSGLLLGDLGMSTQDQRPVATRIGESLKRTLILSGIALVLSICIALPWGVRAAVASGSAFDRMTASVLFLLHSMPNFWIASVLIVLLCGGDYLDIFPAFGWISIDAEHGFFDAAWHLVLPVLCLLIATVPYLTRHVRSAVLEVLSEEFVKTARAKGLQEQKVVWKHTLRNALIPLITVFAGLLPMLVSGSLVIEFLFSIPGIGKLTYDAIMARDYPLVYGSVLLVAVFTITLLLLADLLYTMVDPRISFTKLAGGEDE